MPTKASWLNVSVLLLHNFVKESKTRASCFPIYSLIFRRIGWRIRKQNFIVREISLFRVIHVDGLALHSVRADHKRQREHHLKLLSRLLKVIMRAKCVLIMLE